MLGTNEKAVGFPACKNSVGFFCLLAYLECKVGLDFLIDFHLFNHKKNLIFLEKLFEIYIFFLIFLSD